MKKSKLISVAILLLGIVLAISTSVVWAEVPEESPAKLGDFLWFDANGNGIQDIGESGVPNQTIYLTDCNGNFLDSTVTGANGFYLFSPLVPGSYAVQFTAPGGYIYTTPYAGDEAKDSDANVSGMSGCITLLPGEVNRDVDAGLVLPAKVGDRFWFDNDGDGIQDTGEQGIPNVTVNLTDCSGNILASDVTDGNGNYLFSNLLPGTYCVVVDSTTLPENVMQTFEKDGSLNGNTSQSLAVGQTVLDVDFGYKQLATVGDRVWFDDDGDGVQDAGEAGIPNVTVNLTDCSGNILATDVTDGNGNYLFGGLAAGTYCVIIDETTLPANVAQTFEKDGSLDGDTQQPLNAGDEVLDVDFGYQPLGSIGDTVFEDPNGNGVQEAGEPGIPNVVVNLKNPGVDGVCGTADDAFITSDVTDANGNYLFTGLPQGTYCVDPDETTVPAGYTLTTNNDPQTVDLDSGETYLDADFGYQPPRLTLGDRVWYDQNQDGIQDPNEPGYNGATVDLYDNATCSGSPMASTTTGAVGPDGFYQFTDLPAGDYCLQFGNIPAGWSISPADQGDGTNDSSANGSAQIPNISLTADDPDEDMGIYVPGSLGDSVVCVSTGEGLANITVTLFEDFDGNGVADGPAIATTETDANGFYQFTGLEVALAGDPNNLTQYIVRVDVNDADLGACNVPVPPTEYNPPLDSDNPDDPNNDFEFVEQPATVGDRVWFDNNGDGVQDTGEAGIPNVTVNLTDCAGNILFTDVTDANGNYLFDGLAAGTYCVVIDGTTLPDDVAQTFEKDGSLDGNTQQPLNAGDDIRDVDFGYVVLAISLEKYTRVEVSQTGGDLCDLYEKPQKLTMLYTGDNVNDNSQDPSKVAITGDPMFASPVIIIASEKANGDGKVYFNGQVILGGTFVIDANLAGDSELRSETWVTIYDLNGNVLQSIKFHTSCSQPLLLGDQFGAIQLVGFRDKNGAGEDLPQTSGFGEDADTPTGPTAVVGDTIVWTYIVTNAGSAPLGNVSVADDAGTPGDPSDDFAAAPVEEGGFNVGDTNDNGFLEVGEEWQFTATGTAMVGQYSNLAIASGSAFGVTVTDDDPSHYLGEYSGADLCETYEKPQMLTMLYTGDNINDNSQDPSKVAITGDPMFASPVYIVASEQANGDGKVYFSGQVNLGETFVIDAKLAGDSELRSETWVTIYDLNGNVLQSIKFHTSCSQPLALGDQFGGIQLVGFQDKNGNGEGEIPPGAESRADLCETYEKPRLLTMLYTGDNILDHFQDDGKVVVTGDPMFAMPVRIVASEKVNGDGKIYFDGIVNVGETFVIDAALAGDSELRSETWVTIYDANGNVLQSIKFHTSCSQPLTIGDQFGGIQLVGFQDKNGNGEGQIPPEAEVRVDLCETFERPRQLTMLYTGDNVLDHYQDDGKVAVTGNPMFASPVRIVASERVNGGGKVYFNGIVNVGETFVIDAALAGDSELRSETWVTIYDANGNVLQSIKFHTSCSQPLTIGDQFGAIELVAFVDKNGNHP